MNLTEKQEQDLQEIESIAKRQGQQSLPLGCVPGHFPGNTPVYTPGYVTNAVRSNAVNVATSNRYAAMGFELMTVTEDPHGEKPPTMIFNGGCGQR